MSDTDDLLTAALYSLAEPWRSRFLAWIAGYATRCRWGGRQPTQAEVANWLGTCPALCEQVRLMLAAWQHPIDPMH